MTKRIDPDLFAQLMKLSTSARTDLLEFLGQTPFSPEEAMRLVGRDVAYAPDTPGQHSGE